MDRLFDLMESGKFFFVVALIQLVLVILTALVVIHFVTKFW